RPVWINGNAEMLSRAIRNLVENAINHSPPGTTVEIVVDDDGMVHVLDEGPGIKDDDRELIFRRFWRRDRRRARPAGLGLSIVQRIAEAHAAAVEVGNRPTGGANFSLRFGRAASPATAQAPGETTGRRPLPYPLFFLEGRYRPPRLFLRGLPCHPRGTPGLEGTTP